MNNMELLSGPIVDNEVIETMATARASRYLKADPIPDELLRSILFAATRASSPDNSQPWDFVVVRDPGQRARIADVLGANAGLVEKKLDTAGPELDRMVKGASNLLRTIGSIPVIVFVCGRLALPKHAPEWNLTLSACYAASQNLLVAARAVGVGGAFTILHAANPDRDDSAVREILELPPEVKIVTTIPLGYPEHGFGPVRRKALEEVVHLDRYVAPPSSQ